MNDDINNNIEQNAQVNPVPSAPVNTNPVPSTPVNTNPVPSAPVNDNPINNIDSGKPKKSNNSLLIVLIIALLIIVGIVAFVILEKPNGSGNSGEVGTSNETSNKVEEKKEVTCISGKYEYGDNKIYAYCTTGKQFGSDKEETLLAYTLDIEDESITKIKGTAFFENDTAVDKKHSFKFEDGKLIYGDNKVAYEKIGEYTKEEYAKDTFNANKELFDGKYNNSYKNGDSIVVMYSVSKDMMIFYYSSNSKNMNNQMLSSEVGSYSSSFSNGNITYLCFLKANLDGTYSNELEMFDAISKIKVVFEGDTAKITYESTDKEDNTKYNGINGTYSKIKSLTIDDILDNKFE